VTLVDADDEAEAGDEVAPPTSASGRSQRRTPPEMDALRARMIHEGYPVRGITDADNRRVWQSLTDKRRLAQLQALTGMSVEQIAERVRQIRRQYQQANKS
jgi:hypothetical protein